MVGNRKLFGVFALLLAIVLLGAQLHCCQDLTAGNYAPHVCPICSSAGAAIVSNAVTIVPVRVVHTVELHGVQFSLPTVVLDNTTPRAPPAL